MDGIAIFSDIHANLPALQAVLDDVRARGSPPLYCLGDLVGYATFPNEVVELIRDRSIPTVMGNYDQGIGNDSDDCGCAYRDPTAEALGQISVSWTRSHTSEPNKAYLHGLPRQISLELGRLRLTLVHGSPRRVNEYLYEDRPDRSLERLLDMVESDVLVCGHTHLPYDRTLPSGRRVLNVGSAGKPKDGDPRACYAILEARGSGLECQLVRVEYEVERAAGAIESSELPDDYARMLREGSD